MRILAALLPAALAFLAPATALACSCFAIPLQIPEPGATGLPTNTLLWFSEEALRGSGPGRARLEDDDGNRIDLAVRTLVAPGRFLVFVPPVELAPNTRYSFFAGGSQAVLTEFTTGDGPDLVPPARPQLEQIDAVVHSADDDSCGPRYYARLALHTDGDFVLLDVGGAAKLDPDALGGTASNLIHGDDEVLVGEGFCMHNWGDAAPQARTTARAIALDLAGNATDWSEPLEVQLPDEPSCGGCAGGGTSGAAPLLALAVLALLRRR